MKNAFEEFGLSDTIIEALTMLQYNQPTEVQRAVIPYVLEKRDLLVRAKTGSGKTAAFGIPICELVIWEEKFPQALVLEPTRELAVQVSQELFQIGRKKRLKIPAVFGGFPIDKQMLTVRQKANIVVGTPGRTLDLIERNSLHIEKVKYLIIDEGDLMFDMGFLSDIEKIIELLPQEKAVMLFSATMNEQAIRISKQYMNNPKEIIFESKTLTVDEICQEGYETENEEKFSFLRDVLIRENPDSCMIFCGTREMVNVLFRQMKKERIRCGMLHGLVDQKERLKTIEDFREGRFRILISTDVAARGIDFENITHVINYDFPTSKDSYVHRIGRTGRNGKSGKAVSLINKADRKMKNTVESYTNVKIQMLSRPLKEELEEKKKEFWKRQREKIQPKVKKGAIFNREIKKLSISGGRKSKIRPGDIVATICSVDGIVAEDIGVIDIRDSITYVEILNNKGSIVVEGIKNKTIKGKVRKVKER